MPELKVQKKDGSLEPFLRQKVSGGLIKAGCSPSVADSFATLVEEWAKTAALNEVVKSMDLRAKILELLQVVKPDIAAVFEAYKKTA